MAFIRAKAKVGLRRPVQTRRKLPFRRVSGFYPYRDRVFDLADRVSVKYNLPGHEFHGGLGSRVMSPYLVSRLFGTGGMQGQVLVWLGQVFMLHRTLSFGAVRPVSLIFWGRGRFSLSWASKASRECLS